MRPPQNLRAPLPKETSPASPKPMAPEPSLRPRTDHPSAFRVMEGGPSPAPPGCAPYLLQGLPMSYYIPAVRAATTSSVERQLWGPGCIRPSLYCHDVYFV
ncbi:hypothetical protein GDO81_029378 [Engystomops pustulosus]|uniref:Uncharacterized protein n=1 Tax=Engystomops pustulosus TaxID=76066 RepID=A0AAV6YMV3_ENGPU|nr:hypothetical protein GDO81_029378 [Engystomops pustulosus]